MNFFEAMEEAYKGNQVYRRSWNRDDGKIIKVDNTTNCFVQKYECRRTINAIRLSVQVGNSKERPTFPGMLQDGDYKGAPASFSQEDVTSNDWEVIKEKRKAKAEAETPVEDKAE